MKISELLKKMSNMPADAEIRIEAQSDLDNLIRVKDVDESYICICLDIFYIHLDENNIVIIEAQTVDNQ